MNGYQSILPYAPTAQPIHLNVPRILISHSSHDKMFCDIFVELLASIGFTNKTLIYTSKPEFAIPVGKDIYEYLRKHLNREIWVFFMLSDNFYKSAACLNEMGAVWIKQSRNFSILLPNFKHEDIKGVINPNQHTLDLCDHVRLTEMLNLFRRVWQLPINSMRWEAVKNEFVEKISKHYKDAHRGLE